MKRSLMVLFFVVIASSAWGQHMAVKTNTLGWAAGVTTNLGVEVALAPKLTLDLDGYYNPFVWNDPSDDFAKISTQCWVGQPELRFWPCRKFFRSFIGIHTLYSEYNCGVNYYDYNGFAYGAGLSYGYDFVISKRWRLELNIGAGWRHSEYDYSDRHHDYTGDVIMYDPVCEDVFTITRAGINFTFILF